MKKLFTLAFILQGIVAFSQFDPAGGEKGSEAIHRNDTRITRWADSAVVQRGYYDVSDKDSGTVESGSAEDAYGQPDNITLSLGDSGVVTLYFEEPVQNTSGYDFVVFENGFAWFSGYFLELAFVEVSSDGSKFVRFPAQTLADTNVQFTNNAAMHPEDYRNLAGKHQAPYGTPFDLEELVDSTSIDLRSVHYIRLIDVIGNIDSAYASRDVNGVVVNDPWPTPFGTGGFDLDAIGIMDNGATGILLLESKSGSFAPNPAMAGREITWKGSEEFDFVQIVEAATGRIVYQSTYAEFRWIPGHAGVYLAEIRMDHNISVQRICVMD